MSLKAIDLPCSSLFFDFIIAVYIGVPTILSPFSHYIRFGMAIEIET